MGKSYKDLIVWQKSFELTKDVYRLTRGLPKEELFGLSSQMRRCSASVPSNIAEGQQRNNVREFIQFLGIAKGSVAELETQLLIVRDVYDEDVARELEAVSEIQRMLNTMVKKLREQSS